MAITVMAVTIFINNEEKFVQTLAVPKIIRTFAEW